MKQTVRTVPVATKFGTYRARFETNLPEKGYTVTVPALPGVVTEGDTLKEATRMAVDAIELYCESMLAENLARVMPLRSGAKV